MSIETLIPDGFDLKLGELSGKEQLIVTDPDNEDKGVIISVEQLSSSVSEIVNKKPTITAVNRDIKGGIFNGDFELGNTFDINLYGWYAGYSGISTSFTVDSAIKYSGSKSIKLDITTGGSGYAFVDNTPNEYSAFKTKYQIALKPNTKYRFSGWYKGINISADNYKGGNLKLKSNTNNIGFDVLLTIPNGTFDWKYIENVFTTDNSSEIYARVLAIIIDGNSIGNNQTLWCDNIKLEEVVEIQTDNLIVDTLSLQGFKAKSSNNSVDVNYSITDNSNATFGGDGSSGNIAKQISSPVTFTKNKQGLVTFKKNSSIGSPTGYSIITLQTDNSGAPSGTVLASISIPASTWEAIPDLSLYTIDFGGVLVTPGTQYWVVFDSNVYSATNYRRIRAVENNSTAPSKYMNSSNVWTTWNLNGNLLIYLNTSYIKSTTGINIKQHRKEINLKTDSDGLLNNMTFDFINGKARYSNLSLNGSSFSNSGRVDVYNISGFRFGQYTSDDRFQLGNTGSWVSFKVNTLLPIKHLKFNRSDVGSRNYLIYSGLQLQVSPDNINWLTIETYGALVNNKLPSTETDVMNGLTMFYARYYNNGAGENYISQFEVEADIDISQLSILYNKPTNKDLFQTYVKTLNSSASSVTYRSTKFGFPALEFSNGEYIFLDTDTSNAMYVKLSYDGVSYTTVSDGQNISFSPTTLPILYANYKIPTNIMYVSSNDNNSDSSKDGSMQTNISYILLTEGITYSIQRLQSRLNDLPKLDEPWKDWIPTSYLGSGSMSVTLGTLEYAKIQIHGKNLKFRIRANFTTSGSASDTIKINGLPGNLKKYFNGAVNAVCTAKVTDGTGEISGMGGIYSDSSENVIVVKKFDGSNWGIGSNRIVTVWGEIEII